MPTIAEIIAARQAAATTPKPPAAAAARSIVLSRELPHPENRGQRTAITGPPEERALARTQGEGIPMTPVGADQPLQAWHTAMVSLESELCVMRDPHDPEACWLALRPGGQALPPLLIHRLPWLLWDHPASQTQESQPF